MGSKLLKMLRYWGFKETGTSYEQRFVTVNNWWQNIWQKVQKSSKTGQGQKTLMSVFA